MSDKDIKAGKGKREKKWKQTDDMYCKTHLHVTDSVFALHFNWLACWSAAELQAEVATLDKRNEHKQSL